MTKHIVIDARNRPNAGVGRYTDRLLEHLQIIDSENHYTVLLSASDTWKPSANNFSVLNCNYKQFSLNPIEQFKFAGLLYSLRPDLVHFTMTQQPLLYFGRIVTTTHDLTMLRFTRAGKHNILFHKLRMALYRFLFWLSHRKSKLIIVPSKYVAEDLAKLQPFTNKKTIVTYEASEPELPGKAIKPAGVSKPFIFHTGSPFPHKNIERLIDAFEIISQSHPKLQLVLSGKKEYYFEKLEKKINKSPAKDNIIVTGFTTDGELKWLFKNAEAYILPALSEGFGIPGLEAMVHGCPLASSNYTCLPEIYGDAALFFNPTNVDDMANKIDRLLTDRAFAKELVVRGHNQIAKYSWAKMAQETFDIYMSSAK